jgi:hypothetical protein
MRLVHWARKEPVLPQISAQFILSVEFARVFRMRFAKNLFKTVFAFWHCDDVNMVGHPRVCMDQHSVLTRGFPQQIGIKEAIGYVKKDIRLSNPSLRDVVGNSRKNDSRTA